MLRAFVDVCLAVEFAHVRGIVHRDLKPDNIMLGDFGEVYILDWGVAKVVGEQRRLRRRRQRQRRARDEGRHRDRHAGLHGARASARRADIDGRADIYTLGCLLYEILAGEPLHPRGFHGLESAVAGLDARPSQRGHDVPPELDALCVAATAARARRSRIATARELGESVQRYLDGDRDVALRRQLARDHLERAPHRVRRRRRARSNAALAMREAAAALALDPALDGPAELVGRLMLEPPSETPPEVDEAIAARRHAQRARRALGRDVGRDRGARVPAAVVVDLARAARRCWSCSRIMLAADGVLGQIVRRSKNPRPEIVIVANMLLVFVIARMFSPLLIAPGIAASIAIAMVLTPQTSWLGSTWGIGISMTLGVLVPLVLEELGVLSQTMIVSPKGLSFETAAFGGSTTPTLIVGTVYIAALITGAVITGSSMRRQQREAHRRLHMQAWQLGQLVPR